MPKPTPHPDFTRLTVIVDTRERLPYDFAPPPDAPEPDNFEPLKTIRRGLKTGDYSIDGHEDRIVIERKTLADAHGSLGREHKRFARELERMRDFAPHAYIVIEGTIVDLATSRKYGTANPMALTASLLSMCVKYGIAPVFASNRTYGQAATSKILRAFYKYHCQDET